MEHYRSDVLVIGSGIAGLSFALKASAQGIVAVLTKKTDSESTTNYAQGGIAAAMAADDSPELHREDTLRAGAGLCHPAAVDVLVREGPERVRELMEWGVRFSREGEALSLGREGGHSRRRIVRADDLTGREIERGLLTALLRLPTATILENHVALDVLVAEGRCAGALVMDARTGEVLIWEAGAVLLATGGIGQVYRHTTNPSIATGDGIAMAYRADALLADMEFIQFHPTALYPVEERAFLISEAVRGEGAFLRRRDGKPFMERYSTLGSLAPRDIVARAIDQEIKETGDPYVLLDLSPIPAERILARFPNITAECRRQGIDILREPIPVVPAAHYICGGVVTDIQGHTTVPGLLAAGEVASTGVHGANRLASNSLLEAVVFSHRAAATLSGALRERAGPPQSLVAAPIPPGGEGSPDPGALQRMRETLRSLMWEDVGIVRSLKRLRGAEERLASLEREVESLARIARWTPELVEVRNMVCAARLIVACAAARPESRGLHFLEDSPGPLPSQEGMHTIVQRGPAGPTVRRGPWPV